MKKSVPLPTVSVVIPLYKTEAFLQQCLNSVTSQSLSTIEIILVNDGSPDQCGAIADRYAAKDARIKVIHQENHGVGHARNIGLNHASGEFVLIMDSDDWLELDALQRMYQAAIEKDADILLFALWIVSPDGQRVQCHSGNRAFDGNPRFIGGAAWCRLIKRKLLTEYPEIRFPENIWTGEDTIFTLTLDFFTDQIARIDAPLLCYRQHEMSKLHSLNRHKTEVMASITNTLSYWMSFVERHPEFLKRFGSELAYIVSIPLVFFPYPFFFGVKTVWRFRDLFRLIDCCRNRNHRTAPRSPFAWRFWRHGIFFPPLGLSVWNRKRRKGGSGPRIARMTRTGKLTM